MHIATSASVLFLPVLAFGFPSISPDVASFHPKRPSAAKPALERRAVAFDPTTQLVDVTGVHAWQAPDFAAGDQRGPCPGLNALANHGYLDHSGVVKWEDIATMTNQVYGLGEDIAGFLAFYGAVFDGNILSAEPGYSIGGPSILNQNILDGGGILGTPQGLSGSHNKYESDASSGRGDLYTSGNDYKLNLTRFTMLYELQANSANPSYDRSVWSTHRNHMFYLSKNENPYFFYAPFAGVIASTGGFNFPPRLMSNKSEAYPDNGILDGETLKTFFAVNGTYPNFSYTFGHERIPDQFYRRAFGNEFNAEDFFEDFFVFAEETPEMVSTGGNTGKPDSYAALDLGNFTGGVYNGAQLLEGDNLKCFVFQSLLAGAPDILKGGYSDIKGIMETLTDKVNVFLGDAVCPQIENPNNDQFKQYPGYVSNPAL